MRKAHLPNKGKMDLKIKSKNRGFLKHLEATLVIPQHTVVMGWGEGNVFQFIQQP